MRSRGFWSSLLAAALVAIGAERQAKAQDVWVETVDWVPTSRVVSSPLIPTASVVSTTLAPAMYATTYIDDPILAPTAYVPTRYVATGGSYVVPTYYETRFRRSLFGRRLIPTGTRAVYGTGYVPTSYVGYFPTTLYYPSSYVLPTSYVASSSAVVDRGVVATAYMASTGACCGDAVIAPTTTTRIVAPEPSARRAEPAPARPAPKARPEEDLDDEPALSSEVDRIPSPAPKPRQAPVRSTPSVVEPPPAAAESSPPAPRPVEREKSTARPEEELPSPADVAPAPVLPADDLLPAPGDGLGMNANGRREVRRPSTYDVVDRERRNVLFGRVRERDTGESEEGVRVTLTNRGGAYSDRDAMSDAFGRFAVRVPDGDWTVRVAMPSGRVYAVSEITVSNGLITDSEGRDVPSLTITR